MKDSAQKRRAKKEEEEKQALFKSLSHPSGVQRLLVSQEGKMDLSSLGAAVRRQQRAAAEQERLVASMAAQITGTAGGAGAGNRGSSAPKGGTTSPKRTTKASSAVDENEGGADAEAEAEGRPASPTRGEAHPLDYSATPDVDDSFPGQTRQMRELIFQRALAMYEAHERSLQINPTKHRIGHVLMSEQQRFGQLKHIRECTRAELGPTELLLTLRSLCFAVHRCNRSGMRTRTTDSSCGIRGPLRRSCPNAHGNELSTRGVVCGRDLKTTADVRHQ